MSTLAIYQNYAKDFKRPPKRPYKGSARNSPPRSSNAKKLEATNSKKIEKHAKEVQPTEKAEVVELESRSEGKPSKEPAQPLAAPPETPPRPPPLRHHPIIRETQKERLDGKQGP